MVYKHVITHTNSHLNFKISSLLYSRIDKTFSHLKHKINSEINNSLYIFNKDRVLNILKILLYKDPQVTIHILRFLI